jgi:pyruvate dehydrogenase E1 component
MRWAFDHLQEPDGGSVYLRLTTRQLDQPTRDAAPDGVIDGGYWLVRPSPDCELALVYAGAVAPEVLAAAEAMADDLPGLGILAVTSADRLHADWLARGDNSHVARLLADLPAGARLVTILDGHPLTLSWLGAVRGQRVKALGVEAFGQSADIPDLYRVQGIDTDAIIDAAAAAVLAA